jgi:hypothetical protein
MNTQPDYYADGERNGYLDALMGVRSEIALTSLLPGYASGYRDGQARAHRLRCA